MRLHAASMDRDENGYSETVGRIMGEGKRDWGTGWFLFVAMLLLLAIKLLAGCGAVMAPVDQSTLDKVNAGLRVAQCVETAVADVTRAETKRLLEQPPPVPLTVDPPAPHD